MTTELSDHLFPTSEFLFACFLRAKGVLFVRTEWLASGQAVFYFKQPPDDLLLEWQTAKDTVSARALYDAQNFFRDELRKR